jgi:hypothetical protein
MADSVNGLIKGADGSMGLRGIAGTIANMSAVTFMCVLSWFLLAKWMPEMISAHREDLQRERQAYRELVTAIGNNTLAIHGLQQEIRQLREKH